MENTVPIHYYFWGGVFAACASFCAKLPSYFMSLREEVGEYIGLPSTEKRGIHSICLDYMCQILPFILMALCNMLNWRYFLKGLQTKNQTISAVAIMSATNYIVSVLFYIKNHLRIYQLWVSALSLSVLHNYLQLGSKEVAATMTIIP